MYDVSKTYDKFVVYSLEAVVTKALADLAEIEAKLSELEALI